MERQLNYELLAFHIREASSEIDSLHVRIKNMLGELERPLSEREDMVLKFYGSPLDEAGLRVSLEHAYHHLNFAWNVRCKVTNDANKRLDRDEEVPKAFTRFWPNALMRKRYRRNKGCAK